MIKNYYLFALFSCCSWSCNCESNLIGDSSTEGDPNEMESFEFEIDSFCRWFEKLVGEYKTVRDLLEKYLKHVSPRKAPATR